MRVIFNDRRAAVLCLVLIIILGQAVQLSLPRESRAGSDIYFAYLEGQRIVAGQDPYARILTGDMRTNDKYATYFPLFYLLSAFTQRLGLSGYDQWIAFWRSAFMVFNVGAAAVLYWVLYRRRAAWLAILAALFWFLNRWNLQVVRAGTLDFMPIFCLLLSLAFLPRYRRAAYLLLGLSLALKQIAIWFVPLYLIWAWQTAPGRRGKQLALAAVAIAAIPCVTSLPFLLSDAPGFVRSIAFSVTREGALHIDAQSVDVFLGLSGLRARLPMLGLIALTYVAFWRAELGLYQAGFLTLAIFVNFNPVLFLQYFSWLVACLPLALIEGRRVSWAERVLAQAPRPPHIGGQAVLPGQ